MRRRRPVPIAAAVAALASIVLAGTLPAQASHLPESNAEALEILADYYPGYWWDHTDLTVAVQAAPNVRRTHLTAVHDAIDTWDTVLRQEFDDLITLTDVTGSVRNPQRADIVLHYVPKAGGVAFSGYAICGAHRCPNIMVRSDFNAGNGRHPYSPEYLGVITLHEIGHALGLGHATNLLESTDLMGYGWSEEVDPVMSDCDLDALTHIFAWAFEGSEPHRPDATGPYDCSLD